MNQLAQVHNSTYFHKLKLNDLIRILIFLQMTKCCLMLKYVPDADEDENSFYDWRKDVHVHKHARKMLPETTCKCGQYLIQNNTKIFPWNALIEFQGEMELKYCTGTLINSKIVLTGYDCMLNDSLGSDPKAFPPRRHVDPSLVSVFFEHESIEAHPRVDHGFKVADIIYNLDFLSSFSSFGYSKNNTALIILKEERNFSEPGSRPVCIGSLDIVDRASEFGIVIWDKQEFNPLVKVQQFLNATYHKDLNSCLEPLNAQNVDGIFCSQIVKSDEDNDDELKKSGNAFIAIITNEDGEHKSAIQLGVMSFFVEQVEDIYDFYELFTSIQSVKSFIDHVSHEQKARWCAEPKVPGVGARMAAYKPPEPYSPPPAPRNVDSESMIWEKENITSDSRKIDTTCTCGIKKESQQSGRIVGGTTANPYEFRWHVYYTVRTIDVENYPNTYDALCGGTIINNRFILTAAHCVVQLALLFRDKYPVEIQPDGFKLYIHIHSRKNDKNSRKLHVKRVLYHPGFAKAQKDPQGAYFDWDVALLELKTPLIFDENVIPICLPYTGEELKIIGLHALVSGFGYTNPKAHPADYLQKISVPIQKLSYCSDVTPTKVTKRFICAGTLDRYKDAAAGDSGGPLSILTNKTNQYLQVGIVSWGQDLDAKSKTAAYYFAVQEVLNFIDYFSANASAIWCSR